MSTFKVKTKKYVSDQRVTLDTKHNEMIKYFKCLKKSLPAKKRKLNDLNKQLNKYQKLAKKENIESEKKCIKKDKDKDNLKDIIKNNLTNSNTEHNLKNTLKNPLTHFIDCFAAEKIDMQVGNNEIEIENTDSNKLQIKNNNSNLINIADNNGISPETISKIIEINEEIMSIQSEIQRIENNTEEDKYYLENGDLIFQYFQNINEIANSNLSPKSPKHKSPKNKITDFCKEIFIIY